MPSLSERLEDVLTVYTWPYDEHHPRVCLDEMSKRLMSETRLPLPIQPGHSECYVFEYEREGPCNLFIACEPLVGKRLLSLVKSYPCVSLEVSQSRAGQIVSIFKLPPGWYCQINGSICN
jgi:hypothetical protein